MTERILVVDDEPDLELLIRQKFRRQIRAGEWEFVFAGDGLEALDRLSDDPRIGCVLTDINMPRMDGLTLLGRLRERMREDGRFCRTVVVSAYGDMSNIRTAMNRGAFDFVTKPIDFADLETTIRKTIEEVAAYRSATESQAELRALRRELEVARQIQDAVLQRTFPARADVDLYAYLEPAREVGGDFYDFFFLDDGRLGLVIADVSGKGISAALLMAVSHTLVRSTAGNADSAAACMRAVNRLLYPQSLKNMFVTMFYGILDLTTGELDYCNAGHNAPYLLADGHARPLPRTDGLALALVKDFAYTGRRVPLAPGDCLLLYTDGVVEATDAGGAPFGEERLCAALAERAAETDAHGGAAVGTAQSTATSAEAIRSTVRALTGFAGDAPQHDDVTLLAVKRIGAAGTAAGTAAAS